jgi:hypothetical protein
MGDFEAAVRPGRSGNVSQWGQEINLAKEGLLQTHTARSATDNGGLGGSGGVLVVEPRGGGGVLPTYYKKGYRALLPAYW